MTRLHPRALAAAGLLSLGALLLSGCSSSATAKTASAQPSASGSGSAQFSAYRDCLAKHGVTMPTGRPGGFSRNPSGRPSFDPSNRPSRNPSDRPSGGFGGGGFGFGGASADPATQAALKACASLAPKGGFGGRGGGGAGGNNSAMAAFTSCLKDHGVTLPANGGLRALNTADPKTAAAYKTCQPLLPARGGGSQAPGATPAPSAG